VGIIYATGLHDKSSKEHKHMSNEGSYDAGSMPGGLEQEIERLREQALISWRKEARTLSWWGLHDGMAVLELGGGPGFITEQLLTTLPDSTVTVIEKDPIMIERARQYLEGKVDGRLRIIETSIMNTGLPDNYFDFAFARLIFQHLPNPVGAAREVLRVLKPSGKLVISDPDDKLHLFDPPPDSDVDAILERFRREQASKGGNRYIGRRLPRILKEAGFSNVDLEIVAIHSDIVGIDAVAPKLSVERWQPEIEAGKITAHELKLLIDSSEHFHATQPLALILMLMACGEKV
jgi:ubiquinone/menaquinone biosynthesis C-methylase UbiE